MPNHVRIKIEVDGGKEEVARFQEECFTSGSSERGYGIDFEKIKPMPDSVRNTESGSIANWASAKMISDACSELDLAKWTSGLSLKMTEEVKALGMARIKAFAETGHFDWHSWSLANWGTKWNAYSHQMISDLPLIFQFDTAWSFPLPIFAELVKRYPSLKFHYFAHDDGDCFAGRGTLSVDDLEFRECPVDDPEMLLALYGPDMSRYGKDEDDAD